MRLSVYYNSELNLFGLVATNYLCVYLGQVYAGYPILRLYEKTKDWEFVGYL